MSLFTKYLQLIKESTNEKKIISQFDLIKKIKSKYGFDPLDFEDENYTDLWRDSKIGMSNKVMEADEREGDRHKIISYPILKYIRYIKLMNPKNETQKNYKDKTLKTLEILKKEFKDYITSRGSLIIDCGSYG